MFLDSTPKQAPQREVAISPGRDGIIDTLKLMRRLVREGKKNPAVRNTALAAIQGAPAKYWRGEVEILFSLVRDDVRYTLDINGLETLQTPQRTLELRAGDCDDKSTLLAALLESVGHPTRFRALGFAPGELSHVIVETLVGDDWVPLDATESGAPVGWSPPGVRDFHVIHN